MSLTLTVGILAGLKGHDDEAYAFYQEQFAAINVALRAAEFPEHHEPDVLDGAGPGSIEIPGDSALQYLKRVAAHIAVNRVLPDEPGDEFNLNDAAIAAYNKVILDWFVANDLPKEKLMDFMNLMLHSDRQGYFVPLRFESVLVTRPELGIAGEVLGSSYALLDECRFIAGMLELPLDMDPDGDDIWEAAENQGEGALKWQQFGIEAFACLRLYHAAKFSTEVGAALVFGG